MLYIMNIKVSDTCTYASTCTCTCCLLRSINVVQSRHDALNALAAELPLGTGLHNWLWIVYTNDAPSLLLNVEGSCPWLVNVFGWEVFEFGDVGLDVVTFKIHLLANQARIVALHLVTEEPAAGALHPARA